MKIYYAFLTFTFTLLLGGCQSFNPSAFMQSGSQAFQAVTLSDDDIKALADESCANMDSNADIAPSDSAYAKRLDIIAAKLGKKIDGIPLNYKVYLTKDVNAWAMANGCIRVYSALLDMMSDDEVAAVIGHEIGHIALGHTRKALQVAYGAVAVRSAVAATGGIVGTLSQSQLADIGEKLVNSQFSQKQETQADEYSYRLLKQHGIDQNALINSLEKLANVEENYQGSMFNNHPTSEKRIEYIQKLIAENK